MNIYFPEIYSDELVYSWLARYAVYSGYPASARMTANLFIGSSKGMPKNFISQFKKEIKEVIEQQYSINDLILNHTIYPLYIHFLPGQRKQEAFAALKNYVGSLSSVIPCASKSIMQQPYLRYCPLCVKQDRKNYGETYWHRIHQIAQINCCPEHGCELRNSNIRVGVIYDNSYIPAEISTAEDPPVFSNQLYVDFIRYVADVFTSPVNFQQDNPMSVILFSSLQKQGYISDKTYRHRKSTLLAKKINTYYDSMGIKEKISIEQLRAIISEDTCFNFFHICQISYFLKLNVQDLIFPITSKEEIIMEEKIKLQNKKTNINFQEEDRCMLPTIQKAVIELYSGTEDNQYEPGKVSDSAIDKIVPNFFRHRLRQMPLCKDVITQYKESTDEFYARKIIWAYKLIKQQKEQIKWQDITEIVSLRRKRKIAIIPYLEKHTDSGTAKEIQKIISASIVKYDNESVEERTSRMTENFMNPPEECEIDSKEIIKDYLVYKNLQKVSKIYNLPAKRIKEIIKNDESISEI